MYDFYMDGMLNAADDYSVMKYNNTYSNADYSKDFFTFDFTDPLLSLLKERYHLETIAGIGNEFTQKLRLMLWLSKKLIFGDSKEANSFHALSILDETKNGLKSNCFLSALTLTEMFLAMHFKARMIRCMPIDLRFDECHCMVLTYCKTYQKSVVFDPSYGGIYFNKNHVPMNIQEIKNALLNK